MSSSTEQELAEIAAHALESSEALVRNTRLVLNDTPDLAPEIRALMEHMMDALLIMARMNARSTAHALFFADLNQEMVDKINDAIKNL